MFEVFIMAVQNAKEVDKDRFPNTKFKFVHEINDEHREHVKTEWRQFVRKRVLKQAKSVGNRKSSLSRNKRTSVGTSECSASSLSTPALLICFSWS